jgi:hypothetical protein
MDGRPANIGRGITLPRDATHYGRTSKCATYLIMKQSLLNNWLECTRKELRREEEIVGHDLNLNLTK